MVTAWPKKRRGLVEKAQFGIGHEPGQWSSWAGKTQRRLHGIGQSVLVNFQETSVISCPMNRVRPLDYAMHIRTVTILTASCLLSAMAAEPPAVIELFARKRSHPTSATLKQCPDGHTNLKDVPI